MKNICNSLVFAFAILFTLAAPAQTKLDDRSTNIFTSDAITQILISGSAAAGLYKELSVREGVQEFACGDGRAIAVEPFLCVQKDGSTICLSNIFPGAERFVTPDSCDGPNPSVIGVGDFPPSLKLNPKQTSLRGQL